VFFEHYLFVTKNVSFYNPSRSLDHTFLVVITDVLSRVSESELDDTSGGVLDSFWDRTTRQATGQLCGP